MYEKVLMNPQGQRDKRIIISVFSVLAIAAVAVVVPWVVGPSARSLEIEVGRVIPPGSTREDVLSFLDSRQIEHSDLLVGAPTEARYLPDGRRIDKRFVSAVIHKYYKPFPVEHRIVMNFYFDETDRLIDHDIRVHEITP
jgi:hypothetical protein